MMDYQFLPVLNALLNFTATLLLIVAYRFIRRGNVVGHFRAIYATLAVSIVFLTSYVSYHTLRQMDQGVGHTVFPLDGWLSYVYYTVLIPHVLLAIVLVPLVLVTLYRGRKAVKTGSNDWKTRHRSLARITYPIWLFVSISGVVVYLMLYQLPNWIA